ncbi:MAG TPA: cytochrome c oxidase assembly protein [Herpetosiphonaceae bacterium]
MGGEWTLDWPLLTGLLILAGAYLWAVGPGRRRLGGPAAFPVGKAVAFLSGLLVLGLAIMSPIGDLADRYLFTMHMIQHLLLTMLSAPLLLAGTPEWLLRPLVDVPFVYRILRWLAHPLIAFLAFNLAFNGWHFPQFYDLALRNSLVHIFEHQMMLGTALLLWLPQMSPLPELRASYGVQIIYYFINSIMPTILGALITFADAPLYPTYELAPRIWGISALQDQQIGALIMWVPGGTIFLVALTVSFFRWMNREGDDEAGSAVAA